MRARIGHLSLRALYALVAAVVMILYGLGHFVIQEYRQQQLDNVAGAASHYIQAVMKPLARELRQDGTAAAPLRPQIFGANPPSQFLLEKVWNRQGGLVLATDPEAKDDGHRSDALFRALSGETAVELHQKATEADEDTAHDPALPLPYIEVYAPLFEDGTHELIAVGEVYMAAADLLAARARFERSIWSAVVLSVAGLLALIGVSAALNRRLTRELARVQALADQNRQLRDQAEQTRLDGARANEALLNRIGAEIHDGPVQMLSLILLKAAQPEAEAELTRKAVAELRAMASGLILPELHGLQLADTIRLAAERHESLTGSQVEVDLDPLPGRVGDEFRVCIYRVIQEGLSNAFRHAGGRGQAVGARVSGGILHLSVRDAGATVQPQDSPRATTALGLLGMRHRLAPLGGTARFVRPSSGGGELQITIPLETGTPSGLV